MPHALPLLMTLVPHGGLTWYSPKGARLLSNRDSRKLTKAFKQGLPRLAPRAVDHFAARLFELAAERVGLCATARPAWFWSAVGSRLAWCRKLGDAGLLVKFVHACLCAQAMYARGSGNAHAGPSRLAVAVWRFKVAVAEALADDVDARQRFLPPGVFSLNPKAEGPVVKRLVKRPMRRRRQAQKSLLAYEDASRRVEQDKIVKAEEVRGNTADSVDTLATSEMDIDEPPKSEAVPARVQPSVPEPLVSIEPMDSEKLQAMQRSQQIHEGDDEDIEYEYYEVVECDGVDSDGENPEIDYEDSDSGEEDYAAEDGDDAESFYEGEDYDYEDYEDGDDVMGGVEY
ncbi:hypothetical protein F4775DRAFT_600427 [Biscogniauxia sp. FL1348]|nr:hypothetical protein F4775DRAFT_600427 [Biscogniauxia sp. FL1348]